MPKQEFDAADKHRAAEAKSTALHHPQNSSIALLEKIQDWLQHEKARRAARRARRQSSSHPRTLPEDSQLEHEPGATSRNRTSSESSHGSEALEKLEHILSESNLLGQPGPTSVHKTSDRRRTRSVRHRSPISRRLKRNSTAGSSDSEYPDGDLLVPACETILDNSKTLGYSGGITTDPSDPGSSTERKAKEREAWKVFKYEVLRLAHTLRLKGWRSVPLDSSGSIDVERLSGALTNAVYVVSPPKELPGRPVQDHQSCLPLPSKRPPKLLLRIYGPQVEQLIDRVNELQILRRLARKNIGPRLLGTFRNGRFEQFFNAHTLTAQDLRNPDTSRHIAKRMRELHDGIELLEEERDAGPFVWRNWDKWVERTEEVVSWLDSQIVSGCQGEVRSRLDVWKERGLLCGVEWPVFRRTVELSRKWLEAKYGGPSSIREKLVFAHNDTQYGNLLRLQPSGESPLLLPANEHKRLVVIDFEYASANLPGLEFANHFTEWCYNYHDSKKPFALNSSNYPTPEEQRGFVRAYVEHTPFQPRPSATPFMSASTGPSNSISAFMLDSRASGQQIIEEEDRREKSRNEEIEQYLLDTRLWRVANSAQWVAWGVVQAKVSGMEDESCSAKDASDKAGELVSAPETFHDKRPEGLVAEGLLRGTQIPHEEDEDDTFDYLSYAQDRAMLFWGDVVSLGIVSSSELPLEVLSKMKVVAY